MNLAAPRPRLLFSEVEQQFIKHRLPMEKNFMSIALLSLLGDPAPMEHVSYMTNLDETLQRRFSDQGYGVDYFRGFCLCFFDEGTTLATVNTRGAQAANQGRFLQGCTDAIRIMRRLEPERFQKSMLVRRGK